MRKVLTGIAAGVFIAVVAAPSAAQAPSKDKWEVTIEPYLMGAGMSGTIGVAGQETSINTSASDLLKHLKFGMMGIGMARKGNWGFGVDAIWMSLGATSDTTPAVNVDASQGLFGFYGMRRLAPVADLTFGVRWNYLNTKLRSDALPAAQPSQTKQWADPLVGLYLHTIHKKLRAALYSEIGGFGLGSTFAWQIFPSIGFQASRVVGIDVGWRWLSDDYETGSGATKFKWDVIAQGPVLGISFTF